ncbi:hypothetical protein MHYP_G00058690 [Metynnis hypsauchen]
MNLLCSPVAPQIALKSSALRRVPKGPSERPLRPSSRPPPSFLSGQLWSGPWTATNSPQPAASKLLS